MTTVLDVPSARMGETLTTTAFGKALRQAAENRGVSQTELGQLAADEEERDQPYFQTVVSNWMLGKVEPAPATVFALERALDLRPGALSRTLGYLPLTSKPTMTVEDAIDADPFLPEPVKRAVRRFVRDLRK